MKVTTASAVALALAPAALATPVDKHDKKNNLVCTTVPVAKQNQVIVTTTTFKTWSSTVTKVNTAIVAPTVVVDGRSTLTVAATNTVKGKLTVTVRSS